MKKAKLSLIILVSLVSLISCSQSTTTTTTNNGSNSSNDNVSSSTTSSSSSSSSSSQKNYSIKGRKAQLDMNVDAGLFGSLLDVAMPFDILYKEVDGDIGSGNDFDLQISVPDALKVADYIYERDDGKTNNKTILRGFSTLLSLPGEINSLANKISQKETVLSFSSTPYYDDMLSNTDLLKGLKSSNNERANININYQNGKELTYFINTEEDGTQKLRNYAYTDELDSSTLPPIKEAKTLIQAYIDGLASNDKVTSTGISIDFSILEALYNSMDTSGNEDLAKLIYFISTGLTGKIIGKDNSDNSHDTIISVELNDTGLSNINNALKELVNYDGLSFNLKNANIDLIFNKASGSESSSFTHFDFDAKINVADTFNIDFSLNFYIDPTIYSYEDNALDEMDEATVVAKDAYQRYSAIKEEVSDFYDFGYTFQNMSINDEVEYLGKNISLSNDYGEIISQACTDLEALDSYTKGLIKDGITGVKPSILSEFDKNYIGCLYEYGRYYLDLSKENLTRINLNNLEFDRMDEYVGTNTKYFRPLHWDILSNYKDWSVQFSTDELEIMKSILSKNTSFYVQSVNNVSTSINDIDTLTLDGLNQIIELVGEEIPTTCLDYKYYFDSDLSNSFDSEISNGTTVLNNLFASIENYASGISTYEDMNNFLVVLNGDSFNTLSRLAYDFEGKTSKEEKNKILEENKDNYISIFENEVNSQYSSFVEQSKALTSQEEAQQLIDSISSEVNVLTIVYTNITSETTLPSKYKDQFTNLSNSISSIWIS